MTRSILLLLLTLTPSFALAKHHATPTPTETLSPTPTDTATFTPVPYTGPKLYTFDALWGSKGSGPDQLNAPEGIDISPSGKMVIADSGNNRIVVWDPTGKPVTTCGSFGTKADWRNPPQFNHPTGVYVDPSKKTYVADTQNHRIVVVDEKGLVLSTWGTQGGGSGQFNLPRIVAKDHYGKIWVLDSGNSRVQVFSGLGEYVSGWGTFGDPTSNTTTALMNQPLGMALNIIDQALVADTGNFRFQVFNDGGSPVTLEGWFGDGPNQFKDPGGITITRDRVICITDGNTGRVLFYNPRFEFLGQWNAKDDILQENYHPRFRGIAGDSENRLYLVDMENCQVLRIKPLKVQENNAPTPPTPTPQDTNPYGGVGYPIR